MVGGTIRRERLPTTLSWHPHVKQVEMHPVQSTAQPHPPSLMSHNNDFFLTAPQLMTNMKDNTYQIVVAPI